MDKPAEQESKITRFRRDRRLVVIGLLRSLAMLAMLGTLVFGVLRYHDSFSAENVRRLYQYVKASASQTEAFSEYGLERGFRIIYTPFESGVALVEEDTYHFISGYSGSGFSHQLKYQSPALEAGDASLLIYDRGGTGYCVANSYSIKGKRSTESEIISGCMNRRGDFALVTNEQGYRAGVTVFDSRLRQQCKWQTSKYYVMLAAVSPNGSRFAALCLYEADGAAQSDVLGFRIGEEEPSLRIPLGSRSVYSMKYSGGGELVVICDDGTYIYDEEGKRVGEYLYSDLVMFFHRGGEMPLLALRRSGNDQTRICLLGEDGAPVFEKAYSGSLRAMARGEDGFALLFGKRLVIADPREESETELAVSEVRDVIASGGGYLAVYSDRMERVQTEEGNEE